MDCSDSFLIFVCYSKDRESNPPPPDPRVQEGYTDREERWGWAQGA